MILETAKRIPLETHGTDCHFGRYRFSPHLSPPEMLGASKAERCVSLTVRWYAGSQCGLSVRPLTSLPWNITLLKWLHLDPSVPIRNKGDFTSIANKLGVDGAKRTAFTYPRGILDARKKRALLSTLGPPLSQHIWGGIPSLMRAQCLQVSI